MEMAPKGKTSAEVLRTALWGFGLVLAVAAIGLADYLAPAEASFSLLYLAPTVLAGWRLGRIPAAAVAVTAACAWLIADTTGRGDVLMGLSTWNFLTRLVIFAAMGQMTHGLCASRKRLMRLNAHFENLLAHEAALARIDSLTLLPNTREFLERLTAEAARSSREETPFCVAYIDLDNFKAINDRLGHTEGDRVLRCVADMLKETIRASDLPARLGGDEFAVLFPNTEREGAAIVARRLIERIAQFSEAWEDLRLGASIGVVCCKGADMLADQVLQVADRAMYDAKGAGKGRVALREMGRPTRAAASSAPR